MSGQETPKDDHKENPAEPSSPSKKSTIRNIFKNFPTPSIKNIKGFHQAHGVKGSAGGTSTNRTEESISSGGVQTVGLPDDKPDAESNLKEMLTQENRGEKEGESAVNSLHYSDSNPTLLNQGGKEQESAAASQHEFHSSSKVSNTREEGREDARASQCMFDSSSTISSQEEREGAGVSQHTLDCNSELLNRGEEGGKEEGMEGENGGTAVTQTNLSTQEENDLPPTTSKDDEKRDKTPETNTTEDTLVEPVTHTFSFRLNEPPKDPEPQPDSSSESHAPATTTTPNLNQTHPPAGKPRTKSKKQKGLSSARDGKDSDSSVCSRKRSSKSKTKIKSKFAPGSLEYIEERLRGRIFSGWVEERQWVESVGGYRDVIEVDEWEVEMNQQLQMIISSIPGVQDGTRWINITRTSESFVCVTRS